MTSVVCAVNALYRRRDARNPAWARLRQRGGVGAAQVPPPRRGLGQGELLLVPLARASPRGASRGHVRPAVRAAVVHLGLSAAEGGGLGAGPRAAARAALAALPVLHPDRVLRS